MPNTATAAVPDPKQRLAEELRRLLRGSAVNGYSTLSPRKNADGSVTLTVKDAHVSATLRVIITEDR